MDPITYGQMADLFVPIYFVISVGIVVLMIWAAWCIIVKPFLRG